MIPLDAPWPTIYAGVDARRHWPSITHGATLAASSWPFWAKARYSEDPNEWGSGTIDQYLDDGVAFAWAAWDAVRPGGWLVLNLGDTRLNTGGAGGQVRDAGQRVYRPDRTHGVVGQQWAMVPERAALAVRDRTRWQLTGKVIWRKPTPVQSDCSAYHMRRNRRPGLQHEMVYLFWKPGGRQTFNEDLLVAWRDPAAVEAVAYLDRVADAVAALAPAERKRLRELGVLPTPGERAAIDRLTMPGRKALLGDVWDLPKHTSAPPWATTADDVKAWPDALCERLVLLLTEPDDLVVDVCAGYGSLPRTAWHLGRRGVGFDLYWGRAELEDR